MLARPISLDGFCAELKRPTLLSDFPQTIAVERGIPVYDGSVTATGAPEWARVIGDGPGVFVVKRAFEKTDAIDAASEVFRAIIAEERAAGIAAADHFAKAGANDRIWNSLQKLCLRAPDVYGRYMANPVIDLACRAISWPRRSIRCATAARHKPRTATIILASCRQNRWRSIPTISMPPVPT